MKKIYTEISQYRIALSNASKVTAIASRLASFGYNAKKLQEGKALVEKTHMLHMVKKNKYDQRSHFSQTLQEDIKSCRKLFMAHVQVARQSFDKASGIQRQLGIEGRIPQALSQWLPVAQDFYVKLEEIHSQMTRFAIAAEEVSQGKTMVEAILTRREERFAMKGETEVATRHRDMAKQEMRAWMKDFYSIARVALREDPQWLEALGMKVASKV